MRRLILNIDGPSITVAHWAEQTCLSSEKRALNVEELSGVAQGLKRVLYRGWQRDEPNPQDQAELETLASRLGEIMLGDETRQGLDRATGDDLALIIPRAWLFVPWELAAWDGQPLLSQFGMGRQIAELQSDISSDDDQLGWRSSPTAYIWANPHFDLVAAEREAEWVHRRLSLLPSLASRSIVTSREDLSKEALLKAFQQSDLFHFAGHARVVNQTRTWPLKDGELSAGDLLLSSGGYPSFVFANACGSADVTATESGEGLVEAFLRRGVRHFLGPWTPVQDRLALSFAARFYERLAHGDSIGQAVLQTRRTLHEQTTWGSLALSNYVLYGDPRCRFTDPQPAPTWNSEEPTGAPKSEIRFPVNCSFCGKLVRSPLMLDRWEGDPSSPTVVCRRCSVEAIKPGRESTGQESDRAMPNAPPTPSPTSMATAQPEEPIQARRPAAWKRLLESLQVPRVVLDPNTGFYCRGFWQPVSTASENATRYAWAPLKGVPLDAGSAFAPTLAPHWILDVVWCGEPSSCESGDDGGDLSIEKLQIRTQDHTTTQPRGLRPIASRGRWWGPAIEPTDYEDRPVEFHGLLLVARTDWSPRMVEFACNPGEPRSSSDGGPAGVILVNLQETRPLFNDSDWHCRGIANCLDWEDHTRRVHRVVDHLLRLRPLTRSLSADEIAEELQVPEASVLVAFRNLAATYPVVLDYLEPHGWILSEAPE